MAEIQWPLWAGINFNSFALICSTSSFLGVPKLQNIIRHCEPARATLHRTAFVAVQVSAVGGQVGQAVL